MKNSFDSFRGRALSADVLKNVSGGMESNSGSLSGPQSIRCGAYYTDSSGGGFSEAGECAMSTVSECERALLGKYPGMGVGSYGCV